MPAAGLSSLALLAAGCGGSKGPSVARLGTTTTTTAPQSSSARQSGILYASCMRAHGVSNFPDSAVSVNAAGQVEMHVPFGIKNEAEFASASMACHNDLPASNIPVKHVNIQEELEYAECMRSHGIADFPDPLPGGGFHITFNSNTPQFQAADNACGAKPGSPGVHPNGPP